jgi:hypothetical protein
MRISYSADDLFEKEFGFLFREDIIMYIIIELSSLCVLHDDEDIIGGIEYFVEFDDILMIDEF